MSKMRRLVEKGVYLLGCEGFPCLRGAYQKFMVMDFWAIGRRVGWRAWADCLARLEGIRDHLIDGMDVDGLPDRLISMIC